MSGPERPFPEMRPDETLEEWHARLRVFTLRELAEITVGSLDFSKVAEMSVDEVADAAGMAAAKTWKVPPRYLGVRLDIVRSPRPPRSEPGDEAKVWTTDSEKPE